MLSMYLWCLAVILLRHVIFKKSLIEIHAKFPWDITGLPVLAFFETFSVQIASELYLYTGGKRRIWGHYSFCCFYHAVKPTVLLKLTWLRHTDFCIQNQRTNIASSHITIFNSSPQKARRPQQPGLADGDLPHLQNKAPKPVSASLVKDLLLCRSAFSLPM